MAKVNAMLISDDEMIRGYEHILKNKFGTQSELESINKDLPTYFSMLGFVAFGIDSNDERRYKVTKNAYRLIEIAYAALKSKMLHEEFSEIFA